MCLKWLQNRLWSKQIPEPEGLVNIDLNEILSILNAAFPDTPTYLSDNHYKTTTKDELARYIRYDLIDNNTYMSQYYDCDDFSFALMGSVSNPKWGALPFGIMWTNRENEGPHAVNFFIDSDRKLWVIEPQNDHIFEMPDTWHPYLLIM